MGRGKHQEIIPAFWPSSYFLLLFKNSPKINERRRRCFLFLVFLLALLGKIRIANEVDGVYFLVFISLLFAFLISFFSLW